MRISEMNQCGWKTNQRQAANAEPACAEASIYAKATTGRVGVTGAHFSRDRSPRRPKEELQYTASKSEALRCALCGNIDGSSRIGILPISMAS